MKAVSAVRNFHAYNSYLHGWLKWCVFNEFTFFQLKGWESWGREMEINVSCGKCAFYT